MDPLYGSLYIIMDVGYENIIYWTTGLLFNRQTLNVTLIEKFWRKFPRPLDVIMGVEMFRSLFSSEIIDKVQISRKSRKVELIQKSNKILKIMNVMIKDHR